MKRRLLWVGLGVLAVAGLFGLRAGARKLPFFSVRRIELVGARYLTAAEVAAALGVRERASIFDDTGPWAERVKGLPGVLEARVGRRLPGTLRVTIREAEPVALAQRGNRLVLIGAAGQVLPFDPTRPAADLPIAPADSAVAGLLATIRESDPELYSRIQRAGRSERGGVAVDLDVGRVLFQSGAGPDEVEALSLVADLLTREGRTWRELDARFLPRIVVRGENPA